MNRWILQVSIEKMSTAFWICSVTRVCFVSGHRRGCTMDIFNVSTLISGTCAGQLSALRLAQIRHWNARKTSSLECAGGNIFIDGANIKTWSHICCLGCRKLAQHLARVPQERWIRFTMVPGWTVSDGSTTFSGGVETWIPLRVERLWAVDWRGYESKRLGSKMHIFHLVLLYIERPDIIFLQETM